MKITDYNLYQKRREFLKLGGGALLSFGAFNEYLFALNFKETQSKIELSDENLVNNYINFYEFSPNKTKAVELSKSFDTTNWSVELSGLVENPMKLSMQDLLDFKLEERIYRFRCVETWSMVVPWIGFELNELIKLAKPLKNAKFVKFTTLFDKKRFADQASLFPSLKYPYVEALRLDEAMHPLTIIALGLYKKALKPSNGAPLRLVVPWKYGFKSIKSIVKIEFVKEQPISTWQLLNPNEYGFYANVNPNAPHPRWSQAKERALGDFFTKDTLMFNGYEKEVSYLYEGLDLRKNF